MLRAAAVLTSLTLMLAVAGQAQASPAMSSAAVSRALAFWTPYNHGQPVCPDGVKIHNVYGYGNLEGFSPGAAYARYEEGQLVPNCNVYVTPEYRSESVAVQCAFVAQALGTAWFGLLDSNDPRNVMYHRSFVTPGACYQRRS